LQTLQQLLNALLTVIGVLIMMFWISPLLAVISLVIIPVAGVIAGAIGKKAQGQFAQMWKATGELNSHVEEAYSGHALVKTLGRTQAVAQEFHERNEELRRATAKAQFISGLIQPVMFLLGNANYAVIVLIGCLRVAKGQIPLGNVQAFIQYSRMFTQPITQIASMANLLQSGVASAERVFQVLDADEMSTDADSSLPATKGRVVFDHVSFSYSPDKPLIADLSLVAEPGQTVAIVGPTGAGKTTLVNLLMRFYEVDGGAITLDGFDISTVPRTELRSRLGMVLQDTWLFSGTIHDNIAYGRPEASEEEILDAARAAHVDHFVNTLPDGYQTVIDEDGSNVSVGQKQLITIARAFLSAPDLLILDEATSSVDTRTEMLVQEAMANLRKGRTSFVIAHRLSTIRDADLILVMEHGDIVEQGSHAELLERRSHYHDLYQSQFNAADADGAAPADV
ncbi:MAG: ABC transporter ATP-binding protein, partial [Cutibacterium avidum]|nr:ABC transporter ATP-binding protein [Cutibacterium avidum]